MKYVKRSIYRYIGYFIAFLLVSYVLSFILNILGVEPKNLLLDNAYALNSGYASSSYDVGYKYCAVLGTTTTCDNQAYDWGSWVGRQNIGVRITPNPSNPSYTLRMMTRYSFRLVGSSTYTYLEGNTYTWKIYFQTTNNDINKITKHYRLSNLVGNTGTSGTGANNTVFQTYTWSITQNGSDENKYILTIKFVPNTNLQYLNAYFDINDFTLSFIKTYALRDNVTYTSTSITYEQGLSAIIANQSDIMSNGFENIANISLSNTQNIINSITASTDETNDLIKDDSIDSSSGNDFFDSIDTNQHGISAIITAPLSFIQSFATETCSPISASVFGSDFTIPCMKQKEIAFLGQDFYNIIVILVNGPLVYAICTYFVRSVKHAQDPDDDRIEVADL